MDIKETTYLKNREACEDALKWLESQEDLKTAWENCKRGDWMLWLAYTLKVEKKVFTLAKALCAKTVYHLMEDKRSKNAVDIAEKYGRGYATEEELKKTAYASIYASAYVTYASAYSYAASYAKIKNQKGTADICREILTNSVYEKINEI